MTGRFDSFVIFAEMRTGSNLLEANLSALDGVACHGEAFNPYFIGYPKNAPILGVDLDARDADPVSLLQAIREQDGVLGGFRYFHDHDPRVLDPIIADARCAKVVLTRNPLESYVSWKIAQETGQWKLTDMRSRKAAQAQFDAEEFASHVDALQRFQVDLLGRLQRSGQAAFYVSYEDIQEVEVINGLAAYLGVEARLEALDKSLKVQNPAPVAAKVRNADEMAAALARIDRFDLGRTPNFEPRRGPNVRGYVAAAEAPLLYLPLRPGPDDAVRGWLAAIDGGGDDSLREQMSQKDLRQWKRRHPGHRSFAVLRHPVRRAHEAFCRFILPVGAAGFAPLRQSLIDRYHLPLPEDGPGDGWDLAAHRAAFLAFLVFVKANLTGQTALRVDAVWGSQVQAISGFGELCLPDRLVREETMREELGDLARAAGVEAPAVGVAEEAGPFALADVYDDEIEGLVKDAYQRDYMMFGFRRWG